MGAGVAEFVWWFVLAQLNSQREDHDALEVQRQAEEERLQAEEEREEERQGRVLREAMTAALATAPMSSSIAEQLRALHEMVRDGILTPYDMERAKDRFLGQRSDQRRLMEKNLRGLYELKKTGVLTQVEFDIKKRDILATTK